MVLFPTFALFSSGGQDYWFRKAQISPIAYQYGNLDKMSIDEC